MQTNTFKNILVWTIRIGLLIVPFIPLYIAAGLFFPFITGKAFLFRGIVELVFAAWLILIAFYKEFRPKKNNLLCIAIFIAVVTLATVVGINPLRSFWSNFERMEGLVMYIHLFAYFLVLGNVFKKKDWFWMFNAFIASGLIEGCYGVLQKIGKIASPQGGNRIDGTIGNPAYLAAFMMFVAAFCVYLFLKTKNVSGRIYYAASGLFSLLIIYFTATRGPVLGIFIALILAGAGYLFFKKIETENDKKIKKALLWSLVGLVLVAGLIYGFKNVGFIKNNPTLSRLTNLSFSDTTITSRFSIWQMSWKGFLEKPLLGWGPENYVVVFSKYYTPEMWKQEPWFDRSHNIVFDWLINAGILGLLSYLSIFFFASRELYKNYQNKKISFEELILVLGLFVAYFFQNLFVFDNIATYISFFAILAWIYSVSTEEERAVSQKEKPALDINYSPLVIAGVVLLGFFYAYQMNIKPYFANSDLMNALMYDKYPTTALGYYEKAFNENTFLGRDETVGQFVTFAVSAVKDSTLSTDKKQEIVSLAVKELDTAKSQNPLDPRPFMYSSLFYESVGQIDKAIENMQEAVKISPHKQDIVLNLARLYLGQNDFEKALPIIEKTFNEDQTNPNARIDLAAAYILMGDQAKADQLLIEGFGTTTVTDDILLKSYSIVKKYDRMLDIWKELVKQNPKNINFYKGLAGAYLLNGRVDLAIESLRMIVTIDPSRSSEIEQIINQILGSK